MTRFILTAIAALLIVGALFLLFYLTGMALGVVVIGVLIIGAIVGALWLSLKMQRRRNSVSRSR